MSGIQKDESLISQMEQEAISAASVLRQQFSANQYALQELCARLHAYPPHFAMTIARGSSDHAATYAKYLFETQLGLVTASAAPSVETLYNAKLCVKNSLVIGLSQSGQSPDIAEMLLLARQAGAMTVAFVNEHPSPLSEAAEYTIPLWAGREISVAATKSYIATLSALIHFVALMTQQPALLAALEALPSVLEQALQLDWTLAIEAYQQQTSTFIVGRGYGFPIAQEAALKFKETAAIHAEAFSGAEVLHGPFALVQPNFPLLVFGQDDAALAGILDLTAFATEQGATTLLAVPENIGKRIPLQHVASGLLPLPASLHPICDPLVTIQTFYVMVARLALARGLNPDAPANLSKVTKTW
jgi:glucosamine--fructose-6-phosphate aminotransferase (isomerizing)